MAYQSKVVDIPKREVSYSVSILLKEQHTLIYEYNRIWSIKQKCKTRYVRTTDKPINRTKKLSDLDRAMTVLYDRMMEIESAIKVLESLGH